MKKGKRKLIRIISFLTALIVVISIWAITSTVKLNNEKKLILQSNERALNELGEALDDINVNLQKAIYSSGGQAMTDVSSKLWRSSSKAKESLSEITDGNTQVNEIYKFLSQVGEYTLAANKNFEKNKSYSKQEAENLSKLLKYSEIISKKINELIEQQENGLVDFNEVKSTLQENNDERIYLGGSLNDASQTLVDYPTLIYDGPFSDHIDSKKSEIVENLKEVREQEAKENASKFLGIDSKGLKLLSKAKNNMSTFTFYNEDYTVSVTEKGGIVNYFLSSKHASEIKLSATQAVEKAKEFLEAKGYKNMKESYFSTTDGICTVNFSYYLEDITYYTDLIKVSVALDTGKITAFDATGYLINHKTREIPKTTKYNIEQCEKFINENLEIISSKKAVIPTNWQSEIYTYEYRCKDDNNKEVLIYIDPQTGEEKNILLLLYSDAGTLTK